MSVVTTTKGAREQSLIRLARSVRDVPGEAVECGVFQGGSLRHIAMALPGKIVYGFDTFTGLPAATWSEGEPHGVGDFSDTSYDFARAHVADLPNVILVPWIFPASAEPYADLKFAFAYVDFDHYLSTLAAIDWLKPRMSAGGLMVFDDYDWPMCPGVNRAIAERNLEVELTCAERGHPHQAVHRC